MQTVSSVATVCKIQIKWHCNKFESSACIVLGNYFSVKIIHPQQLKKNILYPHFTGRRFHYDGKIGPDRREAPWIAVRMGV